MDSTYFFDRLYPFQDAVLREMASLDTGFYLTGGTAASRGYLGHRFSDDLDFFVNDEPLFSLWCDCVTAKLAGHTGWTTRVLLRESRFVRLDVGAVDVDLKLEFVNDVPSRVGAVSHHPTLGRLDSAENILANKLTALADSKRTEGRRRHLGILLPTRHAPRAGADVCLEQGGRPVPPHLARRLLTATEDDWRVIRWIDPPAPSQFLADLERLGEALLLLPPPG